MRRVLLIGACLFFGGAVPALAQERAYERRVETTTTTTEVRRASDLIGTRVSLEGDTALGKVIDLVINDRGCIDYLIVRHEDDYLAIPWGVITYEVRERRVVVDVDISRERLREVTFRKDHWPNFYGREFTRTVRTVWGDRALRREHRGDHRTEERRPDRGPGDRRDRSEERRPDTRPGDRRPDREPVNRTPGALPRDQRPRDETPAGRTVPDRRPGTRPVDRTPGVRPTEPPTERPTERPTDRGPGTRPVDRTPGVRPAEPPTDRPTERPKDRGPDRRRPGERPSQGSEPTPPARPGPGGS